MDFQECLLSKYKELLQTTNIRRCYQEFLRLFRYLRVDLEKRMPEFKFQGNIVENSMEYSYFTFTDAALKSRGLKIAVVFVHERFQFEVWVSGMNRKHQAEYFELLKEKAPPFELTDDPLRKDYILRVPLDPAADIFHGHALPDQIEAAARDILTLLDTL